jgi:hypothetical protein
MRCRQHQIGGNRRAASGCPDRCPAPPQGRSAKQHGQAKIPHLASGFDELRTARCAGQGADAGPDMQKGRV